MDKINSKTLLTIKFIIFPSSVKTLVDERTWQANELNYKLQREVEELKSIVHELKKDKQETGHRLKELELEVKTMRIVFGAQLHALGGVGVQQINGSQLSLAQQVASSLRNNNSSSLINNTSSNLHNDTLLMDRERQAESTPISSRPQQQQNQRNHLNIKYGVLNEQEGPLEVLPNGGKDLEVAQEVELMEKLVQKYNYGSSNGKGSNATTTNSIKQTTTNNGNGSNGGDENQVVMQMEKDTFDLRRELQDAVAGKKSAEQRILT